jgi:hypothetical protein
MGRVFGNRRSGAAVLAVVNPAGAGRELGPSVGGDQGGLPEASGITAGVEGHLVTPSMEGEGERAGSAGDNGTGILMGSVHGLAWPSGGPSGAGQRRGTGHDDRKHDALLPRFDPSSFRLARSFVHLEVGDFACFRP